MLIKLKSLSNKNRNGDLKLVKLKISKSLDYKLVLKYKIGLLKVTEQAYY